MHAMLKGLVVGSATLFLAGCMEPPYTNVDSTGLEQLIDDGVTLIDIRTPDEWRETGVVAGSERLTFLDANGRVKPGFLEQLTGEVAKDEPIALICRTGNRTDALARHMVENLGYSRVYNVRDGITGWIGEGRPVDRG